MTDALDGLLAEQLAYYRARAPEYTQTAMIELGRDELDAAERQMLAAMDKFAPTGDVLELACGPGTWTGELLRHASALTALDGSPEMLRLAAAKVSDPRVRFIEADIFDWHPERAYDAVFFGFWLSHVPLGRFEQFWSVVGACLKPGGRVLFVDDAYRERHELIEGENSEVILRRLSGGQQFRAVKVPHTPEELERKINRLGWQIEVKPIAGPFFYGSAVRMEP